MNMFGSARRSGEQGRPWRLLKYHSQLVLARTASSTERVIHDTVTGSLGCSESECSEPSTRTLNTRIQTLASTKHWTCTWAFSHTILPTSFILHHWQH